MKRILYISTALWAIAIMGWVGDAGRAESADDSLKGKLALTVAPPMLPTDGASHPIVHVQLLGVDGSPVLAVKDTKGYCWRIKRPVARA